MEKKLEPSLNTALRCEREEGEESVTKSWSLIFT